MYMVLAHLFCSDFRWSLPVCWQ